MSIDERGLLNLFIEASKLMTNENDRCKNLIYTQTESGKHIIREPEATCVFTNLLASKGINFGVEVPTKERYIISGKKPDSADTDLSIFQKNEQINIEFKTRQPVIKTIMKDFLKFFGEEVKGCAFFHILKNRDSKTITKLLKKYEEAYIDTEKLVDKPRKKWFLFFIFVKEKKECYWQLFNDIVKISSDDFNLNKFKSEQL